MDNVNALLSFVYTLLANSMASALEAVGLDPYVGFMHTDRPGRCSLALDMMEELRSSFADRFVLTLINKKIVTGKQFKKSENGAVILKEDARKVVLIEWQKRKERRNCASIFGRKSGVGTCSICSGNAFGKVFKR